MPPGATQTLSGQGANNKDPLIFGVNVAERPPRRSAFSKPDQLAGLGGEPESVKFTLDTCSGVGMRTGSRRWWMQGISKEGSLPDCNPLTGRVMSQSELKKADQLGETGQLVKILDFDYLLAVPGTGSHWISLVVVKPEKIGEAVAYVLSQQPALRSQEDDRHQIPLAVRDGGGFRLVVGDSNLRGRARWDDWERALLASTVQTVMMCYNEDVFFEKIDVAAQGIEWIDYRDAELVNRIVDLLCARMPVEPQHTQHNLCSMHAASHLLSVVRVLMHEEDHAVELALSWPRYLTVCPVPDYYPGTYGFENDEQAAERLAILTACALAED